MFEGVGVPAASGSSCSRPVSRWARVAVPLRSRGQARASKPLFQGKLLPEIAYLGSEGKDVEHGVY